jgi:Cu-Zn family superoxide dismutase
MTTKRNLIGALLIAAAAFGCAHLTAAQDEKHEHAEAKIDKAVAVVRPTRGNKVRGTVTFTEKDGKVTIVANFQNLTPNGKQAIHIHEFGDIRKPDGLGTGGHYNPEGHDHGLPTQEKRHAGDLGNLEADAEGKAKLRLVVDNITVAGHKNPILGRSIIVHEKADDGGQPVGNAGPRVSQGVIGIANPTPPAAE